MYTLVIVLTILAAILLIGVVLIQKSKGGGLGSSFASSNSILGVKRTNDVVEKVTWWLAGLIVFFSVLSVFLAPSLTGKKEVSLATQAPSTSQMAIPQPNAELPSAPQPAPAN